MTLAFSTSSPQASVAAFDDEGRLLWSGETIAPQRASGTCLALMETMESEVGLGPRSFQRFAADIGPGSFTGVRVGVILAKTFAFVVGGTVVGANAFDLISPTDSAFLPSKRGEFFVRNPGEEPVRQTVLPEDAVGYGTGVETPVYPHASRFLDLLDALEDADPIAFAPEYLIDPSISTPKRAYGSEISGG